MSKIKSTLVWPASKAKTYGVPRLDVGAYLCPVCQGRNTHLKSVTLEEEDKYVNIKLAIVCEGMAHESVLTACCGKGETNLYTVYTNE